MINQTNMDFVTGDTPLLLEKAGRVYIETISSIFNENNKIHDSSDKLEYNVWTDQGWTPIKKVIKHKCDKKIYKIDYKNSIVKVTEDHSLLTNLKPTEMNLDTELLTSYPTEFLYNNDYNNLELYINEYKTNNNYHNELLNSPINILDSFMDAIKNFVVNDILINAAKLKYIFKRLNGGIYSDDIKIECIKENNNLIDVYDLETELGRYQAGTGGIIVKNTDKNYII